MSDNKQSKRILMMMIASLSLLVFGPLWGHEVGTFTAKHGLSHLEGLYILLIPWFLLFGYIIYVAYKMMKEEEKGKGN